MLIRLKTSVYYHLFNCVLFELISGQIKEVISQTSELNLTSNQLLTQTHNISLILDILNKNKITVETNANTSENICDDIDCNNNIEFCRLNRCSPIKRMRRTHYFVTFLIVFIVILLMLTTMYACHKESKRSNRWHNSCNRLEDHMMSIRLVQSLNYNRNNRHIQPMREMIPLRNQPPPPYSERQYTPPPDYQEAVQQTNRINHSIL